MASGLALALASPMLWAIASVVFFVWAMRQGFAVVTAASSGVSGGEAALYRRMEDSLLEIKETLESGLLPAPEEWAALGRFPAPWGRLFEVAFARLRDSGAPVLPTLRRLHGLVRRQAQVQERARAQSAQAIAQAVACGCMLPVFAAALYVFMPSLSRAGWPWFAACALGEALCLTAMAWIISIARAAQWGGLAPEQRPWLPIALGAGERLLARVRSGDPSDRAWAQILEELRGEALPLAAAWSSTAPPKAVGARGLLTGVGASIGAAIQQSRIHGSPCSEKLELVLQALSVGFESAVEREVQLLGTRALQPLFVLVLPALLGLLAVSLGLEFLSSSGG